MVNGVLTTLRSLALPYGLKRINSVSQTDHNCGGCQLGGRNCVEGGEGGGVPYPREVVSRVPNKEIGDEGEEGEPDEALQGNLEWKIRSLEFIDTKGQVSSPHLS